MDSRGGEILLVPCRGRSLLQVVLLLEGYLVSLEGGAILPATMLVHRVGVVVLAHERHLVDLMVLGLRLLSIGCRRLPVVVIRFLIQRRR